MNVDIHLSFEKVYFGPIIVLLFKIIKIDIPVVNEKEMYQIFAISFESSNNFFIRLNITLQSAQF